MTRADAAEVARLRAELDRVRQAHEAALKEYDENRRGLLAMLEDLEASHRKIELAQQEWNAAFDAVLDPIFLHDKDFHIVRANRAYAARAGLSFREIIGRPYWEVFPKGAGPLAACQCATESTAKAAEGEEEIRLETGEFFQARNFSVRDDGGAWRFGVHILQDVTEKRRAEKALRESEEKFHRITAAAQDAILMMDNDGRVAFWNAAAERIFGYAAQEVMGQELHLFLVPERYQTDYRRGFAHFRGTGEGPVIGKILELVARRKDGTEFPVELSVSALKLEERWHAVGILRDITARKQAEADLRLFRTLLDNSNDAVEVIDPDTLRFLDVNEKECRDLGYSREELLSMAVLDIDPSFGPDSMRMIDEQVRKSGAALFERTHQRKDGSTFPVEIGLKFVEIGEKTYVLSVARDITARKEAEAALKKSESKFRTIFEGIFDGILIVDPATRKFYMGNRRICEMLGYTQAELAQLGVDDLSPPEALPRTIEQFTRQLRGEVALTADMPIRRKDGSVFYADITSAPIMLGDKTFQLGVLRDVTERKRAAAALQRSEASLSEAQRIAHIGSWELDLVTNRLTWSDEIFRIFEIDPKEFGASYDAFLATIHPDDREAVDRVYIEHVKQRIPYDIVHRLLFKDGRVKYVHERCETTYDDGHALRSLGTVQDVTERKLAEIALAKVMRALRILSGSNEALIHATDETSLLREVCRIIVEVGGYRMTMVAFAELDEAKTLRPVAHAGFESGYADTVKLSWSADSERGRGPGGVAVRTGRPCIARDIPTDPTFAPWRDEALRRGYRSVIALPLTSEGPTFGALGIYSSESDAFDAEEVKVLGELADDLAYGVINLRARGEQARMTERLRESLVDTIRAIALTVEKRDPYTAGHQNNVAKLCVAIGREMGMDENRLEGMGLAATIHDIGKIYIPAEILNRPGRISDPEFEIIKSHPQVGYDIVKDVKFPWPVAQMILQHHERLDGSGYPKGLKGEDILLEARILAVADVVEAMSSHRPYRPARGLDAALAEIEKRRGTWYDASVVDACARLIKEGRFRFGET